MNKKQIYFKSDFTVILASESQWGGCPFRLSFYTASPSRAFVASFDGENWENCRLLDDGRLEVAINQKDGTMQTLMGIGILMCAPEFYLDNDAFRDHVCNEFVKPFAPVFVDTDGTEYNVILDLNGSSTLVTIGTLPAFYMRGPMGDVDWEKVTPEQLEILQRPAREAADVANAAAAEATSAAEEAISAMESIEAPKDGKAYNRKDGAWTVAEGGMTPAERAKLTALDLKVGELGDFLTNEEIDDIFLGGLKIVDGMLVGSGELEGDTYTISGLNVEDGIAII